MGIDAIITIIILAGAGFWAGRRIWRSVRRRTTLEPDSPLCGGGCGHCPIGTELGAEPGGPCADADRADEGARTAGGAAAGTDEGRGREG